MSLIEKTITKDKQLRISLDQDLSRYNRVVAEIQELKSKLTKEQILISTAEYNADKNRLVKVVGEKALKIWVFPEIFHTYLARKLAK